MNKCLEIDSIYKRFKHKEILTDIYLQCNKGDIIGILGRNGSGKTTLLKIIYGIESAENKFIRLNGEVVSRAYVKENLKYLPAYHFIPMNLKVLDVMKLFMTKTQVEKLLYQSQINDLKNKKLKHLSSGQLRYVEIKIILNSNADFILLDEPFSGLAPLMIEEIAKDIKAASENKGIILTDHSYKNILDISNRLYLLKETFLKPIENKEQLITEGYLFDHMI